MIVIVIGLALGIGLAVWIWKVPVSKTVGSLKEKGSSTFEAYFIFLLLSLVIIATVYLLIRII